MNICMLLARRDFPPDIRVEKEARALVAAGQTLALPIYPELTKEMLGRVVEGVGEFGRGRDSDE